MPKPSCCGESAAHQALAALGPAGPAAPGAMWGVLLGGRAPFHGPPPPTYCGVFPAWARGRGLCGQGPPADSPGRSCLLRGRGRGSWKPPSRQPSADQKGGVASAQGCRDSPRCMSPQPPTAWLPPASPSDALRQALSSLPFSMGPTSRLRPPCQPCDARPSGLGGTRSGPPSILPSLPSPPLSLPSHPRARLLGYPASASEHSCSTAGRPQVAMYPCPALRCSAPSAPKFTHGREQTQCIYNQTSTSRKAGFPNPSTNCSRLQTLRVAMTAAVLCSLYPVSSVLKTLISIDPSSRVSAAHTLLGVTSPPCPEAAAPLIPGKGP